MRIGVYLGSWRLTQLGGMGIYLQNLLRAVEGISRDAARDGGNSAAAKLVLLVDRENRASAAELGLDAEIVTMDRPRLDEIPRADLRRVMAVRRLSYRDVERADARSGERWSEAARQFLWGLDEAVGAARIDLLYFTIPPYLKWPCVPVVLTLHDLKHLHRPQDHDRADLARRRRWERVARRADLVYSSYEHVRRDVVERLGVAAERAAVLPLAPPAELREPLGRDTNPPDARALLPDLPSGPFALMPAQLWPHKNHALVFAALAELRRKRGVEIPIVCPGQIDGECAAHAARMRQLAYALGVGHLVRMPGYVTRAQLQALYEACRVVIVASLYEAGSFPAMEAMGLGKPLIASRVTSNPETVGDAAELFDPTDSHDLATKLARLWNDAARRGELAARGPGRIPDRTWADVAADWVKLCHEALDPSRRSRVDADVGWAATPKKIPGQTETARRCDPPPIDHAMPDEQTVASRMVGRAAARGA